MKKGNNMDISKKTVIIAILSTTLALGCGQKDEGGNGGADTAPTAAPEKKSGETDPSKLPMDQTQSRAEKTEETIRKEIALLKQYTFLTDTTALTGELAEFYKKGAKRDIIGPQIEGEHSIVFYYKKNGEFVYNVDLTIHNGHVIGCMGKLEGKDHTCHATNEQFAAAIDAVEFKMRCGMTVDEQHEDVRRLVTALGYPNTSTIRNANAEGTPYTVINQLAVYTPAGWNYLSVTLDITAAGVIRGVERETAEVRYDNPDGRTTRAREPIVPANCPLF